jgi:LPXTG-site transpeptidase (sortase) family protein
VVLRERLILGVQVAAAMTLPFIVYWIDPPNPVLWSSAIFVGVLIFALIHSYWLWLVLGAVVVSSLPSVFDFGNASDPFMWGCASMSVGVATATAALQPMPERPMFRPRSASPVPKVLASVAIAFAVIALAAFAFFLNRSPEEVFASGPQEITEFFQQAPEIVEGDDDGTNPVFLIGQSRPGEADEVGSLVAALTFERANGRSVVSRDPIYVREGVNSSTLALGPGRYPTPTNVGQIGNVIIAGHRTAYNAPFNQIDSLEIGDTISATDLDGNTHDYTVVSLQILPPDAAWPLNPDPLQSDKPTLTLTTYEPSDEGDRRLVVFATLTSGT